MSYGRPRRATNPIDGPLRGPKRLSVESELLSRVAECHAESFGWALRCCGRNRREAEEVLQDVYLKVAEGRARFDARASLRTWLFSVIRRTAADRRRRAALRGLWLLPLAAATDASADAPGADAAAEAADRTQRLERALRRLPRRQREVLLLVFYHGCTVEEAAAALGIGVGSARTHYARGKARLKELLGGTE